MNGIRILLSEKAAMKILLVSVVAVCFVVCWGNPTGYENDFAEAARDENIQLTRNLANKSLKPVSTPEQFQTSHIQGNRQEYRRFGMDALSQNSPRDDSALNQGHKTGEAVTIRNLNPEFKEASFNRNQLNTFPAASLNQGRQIQKPAIDQQDLRSDSFPSYSPVPQNPTFSNQETRRSFHQEDEDLTHIAAGPNQEIVQKGNPSTVDQRSTIQTDVYTDQNAPEVRSTQLQGQVPHGQRTGYHNQGSLEIKQVSVHDQQPQNQERVLNQNDMRRHYDANQNKNSLGQSPSFSQQEQTKDTFQEYARLSQNNQHPSIPASFLSKDISFRQVQNRFESRRIPSNLHGQTNQNFEQKRNSAAEQIRNNQQQKNQDIRPIEDAQFSTYLRSKDVSDRREQGQNSKQDTERRIYEVRQGHHQNLGKEQAVMPLPQFRQTHATSVLLSGTKGTPLVLYKTGSIPTPHAVVFSKDSTGALSRASISQHLKTPFTQYTYMHAL